MLYSSKVLNYKIRLKIVFSKNALAYDVAALMMTEKVL